MEDVAAAQAHRIIQENINRSAAAPVGLGTLILPLCCVLSLHLDYHTIDVPFHLSSSLDAFWLISVLPSFVSAWRVVLF